MPAIVYLSSHVRHEHQETELAKQKLGTSVSVLVALDFSWFLKENMILKLHAQLLSLDPCQPEKIMCIIPGLLDQVFE